MEKEWALLMPLAYGDDDAFALIAFKYRISILITLEYLHGRMGSCFK